MTSPKQETRLKNSLKKSEEKIDNPRHPRIRSIFIVSGAPLRTEWSLLGYIIERFSGIERRPAFTVLKGGLAPEELRPGPDVGSTYFLVRAYTDLKRGTYKCMELVVKHMCGTTHAYQG